MIFIVHAGNTPFGNIPERFIYVRMKFKISNIFKNKKKAQTYTQSFLPLNVDIGHNFGNFFQDFMRSVDDSDSVDNILDMYIDSSESGQQASSIYSDITL